MGNVHNELPTTKRIREVFMLSPEGELMWRDKPNKNAHQVKPGSLAGFVTKDGKFNIKLDGKKYSANRIINALKGIGCKYTYRTDLPPADLLSEWLRYDFANDLLIWKSRPPIKSSKVVIGKVAEYRHHNQTFIRINGKQYSARRVKNAILQNL